MVPHDAPTGEVGFVISGKGIDFPMSHGLAGGYPGAPGRYVICRGAHSAGSDGTRGIVTHAYGDHAEPPETFCPLTVKHM